MSASIFIKSYNKDFDFLLYCLKSIAKFCSGFDETIIAVPTEDVAQTNTWGLTKEKVIGIEEKGNDPYLWQQCVKINADQHVNSDLIVYVDSDCCFNQPTTPEDFLVEGKPLLLVTPYEALPPEVPWKPITEKALGFECPFETMRRLPYVYPRWLLPEFRRFMEKIHRKRVEEYIAEQPHHAFSEFNALGSWALRKHPQEFHVWNTVERPDLPPARVKQNWSWGGLKPAIQSELEALTA